MDTVEVKDGTLRIEFKESGPPGPSGLPGAPGGPGAPGAPGAPGPPGPVDTTSAAAIVTEANLRATADGVLTGGVATNAAAILTKGPIQAAVSEVTVAGALQVNKHNAVNATSGPVGPMTLPVGQPAGSFINVAKAETDATNNAVTVTGNIRGVAGQSIILTLVKESVLFLANAAGSWYPYADHKPLSSLDSHNDLRYSSKGQVQFVDQLAPAAYLGLVDCTSTFNAALSALPVATDGWAYGVIQFGVGSYLLTPGATNNIGPHVTVEGRGKWVTFLNFVGVTAGWGIYMHGKGLPTGTNFSSGVFFGGGVSKLTVDGAGAPAGSVGVDYGDLEEAEFDYQVRNFSAVATAATTSSALLSTAAPIVTLPVNALSAAGAAPGTTVTITSGGHTDSFVTTTGAAGGALTVAVTSQVPSFAYPSGSVVTVVTKKSLGHNQVNRFSWTEKAHGLVICRNNGRNVVFDVADGDSTTVAAASNGQDITLVNSITLTAIPASWAVSGVGNVVIGGVPQPITFTGTAGNVITGVTTTGVGILATGQSVIWTGSGGSHAYCDLRFRFYATADQDGIAVFNGANPYGCTFDSKGNWLPSGTVAPGCAIRLFGKGPIGHRNDGGPPQIGLGRMDFAIESGVGAFTAQTLNLQNGGSILSVVSWRFGGQWTPSNVTTNPNNGALRVFGAIFGDANLNAAANTGEASPLTVGAFLQNTLAVSAGACKIQEGDYCSITLNANTTISFAEAACGAPQRKVWVVKQAHAGGPWTLTWPTSGAPTTSTPNFVFQQQSGGAAPAMPATADSVLVVEAWTVDGATWYAVALTPAPAGVPDPIVLAAIADPAAPSAGNPQLYPKTIMGRDMWRAQNAQGKPYTLQPGLFSSSAIYIGSANAAVTAIGTSVTNVGTPTTQTFSELLGCYTPYLTGVVAGNTAGTSVSLNRFLRGSQPGSNGFFFRCRLVYPDATYGAGATGMRTFCGLSIGSLAAAVAADDTGVSTVGFQFSTNRGDTNWQFTTEGGVGTQALVDTGIPFVVQHSYDFGLFCAPQGTTIFWRLEDLITGTVVEGSRTTNLPANTQTMKPGCQIATLTTTGRNIGLQSLYCESDR